MEKSKTHRRWWEWGKLWWVLTCNDSFACIKENMFKQVTLWPLLLHHCEDELLEEGFGVTWFKDVGQSCVAGHVDGALRGAIVWWHGTRLESHRNKLSRRADRTLRSTFINLVPQIRHRTSYCNNRVGTSIRMVSVNFTEKYMYICTQLSFCVCCCWCNIIILYNLLFIYLFLLL